jgi:hypothetical protein
VVGRDEHVLLQQAELTVGVARRGDELPGGRAAAVDGRIVALK